MFKSSIVIVILIVPPLFMIGAPSLFKWIEKRDQALALHCKQVCAAPSFQKCEIGVVTCTSGEVRRFTSSWNNP